jgi:hypothetical protein
MAGEASMFIIVKLIENMTEDNQPIRRKSLNRPINSRLTEDYEETRLTSCNNYS